jgi:hypothetical protein
VIASHCLEVISALKKNYHPIFSTVLNEIKSRSVESRTVLNDLACTSLDLDQGHRSWLLNLPDKDIVPLLIEYKQIYMLPKKPSGLEP